MLSIVNHFNLQHDSHKFDSMFIDIQSWKKVFHLKEKLWLDEKCKQDFFRAKNSNEMLYLTMNLTLFSLQFWQYFYV